MSSRLQAMVTELAEQHPEFQALLDAKDFEFEAMMEAEKAVRKRLIAEQAEQEAVLHRLKVERKELQKVLEKRKREHEAICKEAAALYPRRFGHLARHNTATRGAARRTPRGTAGARKAGKKTSSKKP